MMTNNTTSSLICFKNGYCYVNIPVKLEDESTKEIKECNVGPLPSFAVLGTVEIQADNPDDVKILSIAQTEQKKTELKIPTGPDFSFASFVEANQGNSIQVAVKVDEASKMKHIDGTVMWTQDGQGEEKFAILQTVENVDVLIDCSKIAQIEASNSDEIDLKKVKSLAVRYKEKNNLIGVPGATLSYLTKGLTWSPSYTLLLNKINKTLKLEGNACLLCDLPFVNGEIIPDISLVSGQPKIKYGNLSDPLASGKSDSNFIDHPRSEYGSSSEYAIRRLVAESHKYNEEDAEEGIKGGETVEDFYYYNLKNVPLKHNQPLSMHFIEECPNVEYEDIYYLDLNKKISANEKDDNEEVVEAIHAISFKNVSEQPLTSAPVSVLAKKNSGENDGDQVNENNFIVQGLMKITPAGKFATVEITKAMDVDGKFLVETSQERKTELVTDGSKGLLSFFSGGPKKKYADSIEKNAKVLVNNSKDEEIDCKIEYLLFGHLEASSPEPIEKMERQQSSNSLGLNPTTKYVWKIKVPAKTCTEITFKFCIKEWNTNTA